MATACPVELDRERLQREISKVYARVAEDPMGDFHFHRGPAYAVERLGYGEEELGSLPLSATASFAGVGNPHALDGLRPGETVVDIGCGGGMDLLLAARRVGPSGRAIGVDMTEEMIRQAEASAARAGLKNVEIRRGHAESLPLDDASADAVISNGVLNLTPDKVAAFREIHRVLRPGGRLLLADIVVGAELPEAVRSDIELWAG